MFRDDDPALVSSSSSSGVTEPPRHIQEMRRSATVLLRGGGAYAEESDFQDDILVYHLVALRDARTPGALGPDASQIAASSKIANSSQIADMTMALAPPQVRSVAETVNNIMSSRRQSEDATREERSRRGGERGGRRCQSLVNGFTVYDQDCHAHPLAKNTQLNTQNNTHLNTHVNRPRKTHQNPLLNTQHNTHPDTHNTESLVTGDVPGDSFLSAYHELMLWLGRDPNADPDDDDPSDLVTFRGRVQALRKKEEEEGLEEEVDFNSWKEEEEEEERRSGSREQGISFTGQISSDDSCVREVQLL